MTATLHPPVAAVPVAAVPVAAVPVAAVPVAPNALGSALGLLGDEWSLLIVRELLLNGPRRFSELQTGLAIGPTVLAARLAALSAGGVVHKAPDGAPAAYRLTRAGRALWSLLLSIWAWEQRWVQGPALPVMRHAGCGKVFAPVLCCLACAAPTTSADVSVTLGPSGQLARCVPAGTNRRRAGLARVGGTGLFPETMALMGSRWSSGVLGCAFLGAERFSDFAGMLGAPPTVVAERLRTFVGLGVLDARYRLTAKGRDFFPTVALLVAWGERWLAVADGPALLADHGSCGSPFRPALRCSACDARLHGPDVLIEGAA